MSLETFFGSEKFNLFQTITPYKGSKKGLLIYRIICLIVLVYGLYGSVYVTIHHNPHETRDWIYFAYFTNQTYFCIIFYFLMGIINYFRNKKGTLKGRISNTYLHVIVHVFYNILFPLSVIVTIVFWGLMFPKMEIFYFKFTHWAQELIQHLFQTFMIGIDWFLITIPTNYAHFIPMFIIGITYLIYTQIYHVIYDLWIYKFLSRDNKYWYVLYIGLVIGWSLIGLLFAVIQRFKNRNRRFVDDDEKSSIKDGYDLA